MNGQIRFCGVAWPTVILGLMLGACGTASTETAGGSTTPTAVTSTTELRHTACDYLTRTVRSARALRPPIAGAIRRIAPPPTSSRHASHCASV